MSRSKKPQTDPPERLSEIERRRISQWCETRCPRNIERLNTLWQQCRDWHLKHGEQAANWEAAFRMWIRLQAKIDARGEEQQSGGYRRPQIGSRELPRDPGVRSGTLEPIAQPILQLIGGSNARKDRKHAE
jgi:hypothetical protein